MDENIYQIAEQIVHLHQKVYDVYLPLVEDVCNRTASEDELSHLLDYLLDMQKISTLESILQVLKMNLFY